MKEEQIEIAARKLCEIRGKDPDAKELTVDGVTLPNWQWLTDEILRADEVRRALNTADESDYGKYEYAYVEERPDGTEVAIDPRDEVRHLGGGAAVGTAFPRAYETDPDKDTIIIPGIGEVALLRGFERPTI